MKRREIGVRRKDEEETEEKLRTKGSMRGRKTGYTTLSGKCERKSSFTNT
jgi:hypothetical protein